MGILRLNAAWGPPSVSDDGHWTTAGGATVYNSAAGSVTSETAMRIGLSRDWLSMKRARYLRGQTIVTERVEADIADFTAGIETLAAEIADLEASGRRSRVPGLQRKKSDDEAKLAILQNLVKK